MKSRQKLKGSVLFTVVAVMMVVLVFVMSALTIAGATSRRAYSDYAKAQTQYTARSAIDATITYLQDSTEFARKVKTLNNTGDSFDVTVSYESSDGSDDITVKVELVAKDYAYTDGETHDVVTITASSSLLDENSSVSLFLLKDSPGSSSGGFSNALTTLGSFNPRSGKITSYGGTSVNLNVDDGLNPSDDPMRITESNGAAYSGNLIFNSSIKVANGKPIFRFDKDIYGTPQGMVVYGDFDLDGTQSEAYFISEVDYTGVTNVEYSEIPYLFIDGTFDLSDGVTEIGSENSGFNIFCNQFLYGSQNNRQVYADTYIWNSDPNYDSLIQKFKDYNDFAYDYYNYTGERGRNYTRFYGDMFMSSYSYNFNENNKFVSKIGNDGGTQLLQWAGSIVNGETSKEYGGNIFTKGSLSFSGQSTINGDVTAEQGVYMSNMRTNPWGWEMREAVRINGRLTVGGVLFIDNQNGRNSYVESLCISSPDNVIIRGRGLQVGDKIYNTTEEFINACNITDPADPNYNPNIIVDATLTTNTFPEKMTRDEVLKFVSTKQAAVTQHQDPSTGEYSQLKHRSDFSAAELIEYRTPQNGRIERTDAGGTTNLGRNITITDSCTLTGDIMGAEITFDAAAGSKLYVILDNVNLIQGSKFYVNSNGGDVYFFCDTSCSFDSGGLLMTTNYKEALDNHQPIDILQSPGELPLLAKQHLKNCNICSDEDDAKAHIIAYHKSNCCSLGCSSDEDVENHLREAKKWMPNVYFYMDKRADGSNSSLYMGNNTLLTAYLYAPYTNVLLQDTKDMEITYDGEPIRTRLSVIGSTVAADVNTYSNEEAFIFIDPSGSSEGISDADGGTWFPMYYQNSSDVE